VLPWPGEQLLGAPAERALLPLRERDLDGAGGKRVSTESASWDLFAGVGAARVESTNDSSACGAELRLGQEPSHEVSESTMAKPRVVLRPGGSGLGTRLMLDASLATAISGAWTLNTGLLVRDASRRSAGQERPDTLLAFGFGCTF
jgi:hypothetical protein